MPEVVKASPVREDNQAQDEQRHEHEVLSDHDALLLLFLLTEISLALCHTQRCDAEIPSL